MPECPLLGGGLQEAVSKGFDKVEIGSAFEFDARQSSPYGIGITTNDSLIGRVRATKEGDTLKISLKTISDYMPKHKVTIAMAHLRGLDISFISSSI